MALLIPLLAPYIVIPGPSLTVILSPPQADEESTPCELRCGTTLCFRRSETPRRPPQRGRPFSRPDIIGTLPRMTIPYEGAPPDLANADALRPGQPPPYP